MSHYMTRQPWTIRKGATMAQAHALMRKHAIRHLPVLDGGALVGLVSERDLHLIETQPGGNPAVVTVEEAMTSDVYTVELNAPIDGVVEHMAERKQGSAIVIDPHGAVLGIFTTVDALQMLAEVLRKATR